MDYLSLQHVTGPVKVVKVMVQTCVLDVRRGTHCRTTCVLVRTYYYASAQSGKMFYKALS